MTSLTTPVRGRPSHRPAAYILGVIFIFAVIAALAAYTFAARSASADTVSLVPNGDGFNEDGWQADDSTLCGGAGTVCSSRVDDDVDAPNDADFIRSVFNPQDADMSLRLTDAPANLGIITEIEVRFRAYKEGPGAAAALVGLFEAIDLVPTGLIGTPTPFVLTDSVTEYSYTISGINLLPTQVNSMLAWVRADISGAGPDTRVIVTAINADATFTPVVPNPALGGACGLDVAL
ncbi:MAG: hypothetical protein ACE5FA_07960, partial [Dehalococcoidia bacterium]